ncbi:MAG: flagellar basal body protein [Caulobacterales bacterium]|jgi:hypothetical protein
MPLLADNATDRAQQLLALTERLTGLIQAEIVQLDAMKPPPVGPEADEKARLVNIYRHEMVRISQEPALIAAAPAATRAALRKATETLNATLDRHMISLTAQKEVSEGLVQAIAEEVGRHRAGPAAYTAAGSYRGAPASATAVAVNRSA